MVSDLEQLLELQANDTRSDQLRHRRETLPQRAALEAVARRAEAARTEVEEPLAERSELRREQKRLEDEVATIEAKATDVHRQLYESGMTSPKEAQALQADLESLQRRQSTLEDEILELMEKLEPLDLVLSDFEESMATLAAQREELEAELRSAEAEVDAELAMVATEREALAATVPDTLRLTYETMRPRFGGVAVARLAGSTCQGCFLTLAPAELDRLRRAPAEEPVTCPDCGRMLVR